MTEDISRFKGAGNHFSIRSHSSFKTESPYFDSTLTKKICKNYMNSLKTRVLTLYYDEYPLAIV